MSVQMIDVPKDADMSRTWLGSTRVTRTNALPKQSLFGTSLQQKQDNLIDDLRKVNFKDTDKFSTRTKACSPNLDAIFGQEQILQHSREQLAQRKLQISRAERLLRDVEEKAKYFHMTTNSDPRQIPRERPKENQKMTETDLYHASDINNVGLHNGSYNHAKYNPRKYPMAGDTQGIGNKRIDIGQIAEKPNHLVPPMQPFKRHRDPYEVPKESYMKAKKPETFLAGTNVTIPVNIRHKFGTLVCDELLGDPEKVKYSISQEDQLKRRLRRPHQAMEKVTLPPQALEPSYDELGTTTRANLFGPGITRNHKIGTMKEDFSDLIHKRRVAETDEYRYHRDELSTWWQHETLRGRMKKKWEEYEETRPKFTANWDRDAKRPPPQPKQEVKKAKPKPKPKPKDAPPKPESDIVFEDIEFVTPPLTPPPPRQAPAPPTQALEDNDFWEFYEQDLPGL